MEFNPPWKLVRIRPCPYLRSTLATICRLGSNVSVRVGDGMPPGLGCGTQPCNTVCLSALWQSPQGSHTPGSQVCSLDSECISEFQKSCNKDPVASSVPAVLHIAGHL